MADVLSKICSMANDHMAGGNKSMVKLLKESGYSGRKEAIAKSELIEYLMAHPDLIDSWARYSSDKRCLPGWYLLREADRWTVGYIDMDGKESEQTFLSEFEACAIFILNELEQLTEYAH